MAYISGLRARPQAGVHYRSERHVVIAKRLPERAGQEWVEWEEVPGPAPSLPSPEPRVPQYLDIVFVAAHPAR